MCAVLVLLSLRDGYSVGLNGQIYMQSYKYFLNFTQMPLVAILLICGVLLVLLSTYIAYYKKNIKAIWIYGVGVISTVIAIFLCVGLNDTSFYSSYTDLQSSLTIRNASSSLYTLEVMAYVSLLVPFVLAYIAYVWRLMDKTKITPEEIKNGNHGY
ncbi:cytochrome d ubiquinol oxidase subunit II [Campylobacter hyointestinalis]|uniref:cytochrome d ubiquinol oxidase subunit II n=1 Tax=Campylobacter hyointestinalis TaxID=198 RepID=UPI002157E624|nr:cytochrome d ubiquinol oxidase subunit II [Campylobacter hyointestinalis]